MTHINELMTGISALIHDADNHYQCLAGTFFDDALRALSELKAQQPGCDQQADKLTAALLSLTLCLTTDAWENVRRLEDEKKRHITIRDEQRNIGQDAIRVIALRLWAKETMKTVRISKMCEHVWKEAVSAGLYSFLPDRAELLADIIRPVAPAYAKSPGRPRKTP